MELKQITQLFAFIEQLDSRIAGDETKARAWQLVLSNRIDYNSALNAIKTHYGRVDTCIMPAHINKIYLEERKTPAGYRGPGSADEPLIPMPDYVRAYLKALKAVPRDADTLAIALEAFNLSASDIRGQGRGRAIDAFAY